MQPFLDRLARHLIEQYGENLQKLCIVFPSRRAGLFMRHYISRLIDKPIWLPDIYALEDFVIQKSGLRVPDQLSLLVKLYRLYQSVEQTKVRRFNEFIQWGNTLLADFDEIDQYMADGNEVFSYLDEIKAIKQWNPDGDPLTEFETNYLRFYNSLAGLYKKFRDELYESGEAYFGMAFNRLNDTLQPGMFRDWEKVIFAGFNALTLSEEKFFSRLIDFGLAEIFWDADEYYMKDSRQEAGHFLRTYFQERKFGDFKWVDKSLLEGEKSITVIGAPGAIGQAKLAGQLTEELIASENPSDIAIVMVDEGLMLPVLNSIPAEIEHFNVTMGYPLKFSAVYALFDSIFKVLLNAEKYSRKSVNDDQSLNLRFLRADLDHLAGNPYLNDLCKYIEKDEVAGKSGINKSLLTIDESRQYISFRGGPVYELIAEFLETDSLFPQELLKKLARLIDKLVSVLKEEESTELKSYRVDQEYLYQFAVLLKQMTFLVSEPDLVQDLKTFYEIFQSQVKGKRLPFYGEPLKGLQIMGMLETRAMDFKNIVMLSVNEGLLPKAKHQNTFLPDEVRGIYNLPRYNDRNAVFGYHFYRLMQRAEKAYLVYSTEGNELGGGEKSRFITQLLHELPGQNPGIRLEERVLSIPPKSLKGKPLLIPKDQSVVERLKQIAKSGFSPSALGTYLNCSMQFYYLSVAGISKPDLVEESIDAAMLGKVIHQALQNSYGSFLGKRIHIGDLDQMLRPAVEEVRKVFMKDYPGIGLDEGRNLLILKVAENMITRFIQAEKKFLKTMPVSDQFIEILQLEEELDAIVHVPDPATGEITPVVVHGKADRIDKVSGTVRVIDYKTGLVNNSDVKIGEIGDLAEKENPAKMLQLLMYAYMFMKKYPDASRTGGMISGIISLRRLSDYLIKATIGKEEIINHNILAEIEEVLAVILSEIFNPQVPFQQTENLKKCEVCVYQEICNRVI